MDQQSQSRKWMILVATIWIQAFTGTNFDFSAYSTDLKSVLGISQLQLNYLAVASDLGKALGWSSGLALLYVPLWPLLFVAAFMGLFGYGLQWLLIHNLLSLPYFLVFVVCLMAGCSICWFNTVCFVLCIQNFPANRALALSLTISFNGVSPALYTLAANAINPNDHSVYLLLNAFVPLFTSFAVLLPIFGQPRRPLLQTLTLPADAVRRDSLIFLFLYFLAVFTGLYLLLFNSISSSNSISAIRFHLAVSILLLLLPLCIPGGIAYRNNTISFFCLEGGSASSFNINNLVDVDELDQLHKELIIGNNNVAKSGGDDIKINGGEGEGCCCGKLQKDGLAVLGEEHTPRLLLRRWDFWLYYMAYFCGGTIGLVYSNNLGQIAESLGFSSTTTTLLTLYSSFSFFGRLLSAAPDFMPWKQVYLARTGWLTIALVPMPIALFVVATSSGSGPALHAGTALIGLSSGFIFAAAVSITSELFGPNSIGVNHNILITNIPLGSLLYGLLAATIYDANVSGEAAAAKVCMGRRCYLQTFVWWGCFSVLGLASSVLLFIRTRSAYHRFELNRPSGCNNCINGAQMDIS